jgi:hypothetical protein
MTSLKAWMVGAALSVWISTGCGTVMRSTRLSEPVRTYERGLGIHVAEVHVSQDVRVDDFSDSSRVLVVLDLTATQDTQLDLQNARLTITGLSEPGDVRNALATGIGQPPVRLVDGEFAAPLVVRSQEYVRAWVAFGNFPARASREIPERIALDLPTGHHLELSRPGQLPLWRGEAQQQSSGTSLWLQLSADESAFNLTFSDNRFVAGPLVIGTRFGIGIRAPIYLPDHTGDKVVCCNLALAADVAWPIWPQSSLRLAPFIGVESSWMLGHEDITRRNWVGPSVGLELSTPMQVPLHGPFPIDYPRSLLGSAYVRVAFVHWFGADRDYPSFGAMLSLGTAYGW